MYTYQDLSKHAHIHMHVYSYKRIKKTKLEHRELTDYGKRHSRTMSSLRKSHRYATDWQIHSMPFYPHSGAICSI